MRALLWAACVAAVLSLSGYPAYGSEQPFVFAPADVPQPITSGDVIAKWNEFHNRLENQLSVIETCKASCPEGVEQFRKAVADTKALTGLILLANVNRSVNLRIIPTTDIELYGIKDWWADPLQVLTLGKGDCEDYVFLKYAILREVGFDEKDLRPVIVKRSNEDHMVLAVRWHNEWLILDDQTLVLNTDRFDFERARFPYRPEFALESNGTVLKYPDVKKVADR